jgi:hypothetical protein
MIHLSAANRLGLVPAQQLVTGHPHVYMSFKLTDGFTSDIFRACEWAVSLESHTCCSVASVALGS